MSTATERQLTFKTEPYAHQLRGFKLMKDKEYFALHMDMGTGKSKLAIDVAAYRFINGAIKAVLVIAPNNVHIQWIEEQFDEHCAVTFIPFVWRSDQINRNIYKRLLNHFLMEPSHHLKVMVVNVEAFQANTVIPFIATFVKKHETFIILDEATRIKTAKARRSQLIHRLNKYGQRCELTGTPVAKSPLDLWSQFEFLKANYFKCTFFIFQHRYGIMMQGTNPHTGGRFSTPIDEKTYSIVRHKLKTIGEQRNGKLMPDDYDAVATITGVSEKNVRFIEQHPAYTRHKRLQELKDLIAPDVFTVTKEECLDLPPKVYERIFVTPSKEQMTIYKRLKSELLARYDGQELTVTNKVALTTRLLQICGGFFPYIDDGKAKATLIGAKNVKLEAIKADLDEVSETQQVIIWAHFVKELKLLHQELTKEGYTCVLHYGGTLQMRRQMNINDFQDKKVQIFIGNPSVAGFGLNLQNGTLQYFFSNSFRTEERLQAEDRSHRIGVQGTCVYKDVVLKGTVDEKVYQSLIDGKDMNDFFKQPIGEILK